MLRDLGRNWWIFLARGVCAALMGFAFRLRRVHQHLEGLGGSEVAA